MIVLIVSSAGHLAGLASRDDEHGHGHDHDGNGESTIENAEGAENAEN